LAGEWICIRKTQEGLTGNKTAFFRRKLLLPKMAQCPVNAIAITVRVDEPCAQFGAAPLGALIQPA
jgi:hypothetical protein